MLKRLALLITAATVVFIPILLLLPTSYSVTVKTSKYYENCQTTRAVVKKCEIYDPPKVITKREPFIKAWWNKTQIGRQYALRDVSTEWADKGSVITGKGTTGVLAVFVILLQLIIAVGIIYLFVRTLIEAVRLKGTEKVAWLCLILFLFPFGSIIFALVKPQTKS